MRSVRRFAAIAVSLTVLGFVLIQLVPYGRDHTNPPVIAEPQWNSADTRVAFMQSCGDCHSNQTDWRWYTNIAPGSWLVQHDVAEGREKLNVSEWGTEGQGDEVEHAAEVIVNGEMPPRAYLLLHPEAKLDGVARQTLIDGIVASFGPQELERSHGGNDGEREEDEHK